VCPPTKFCFMKSLSCCVCCLQSLLVPFCIIAFCAPTRYCVYTPVNEYPKLGIFEPLWCRTFINGFPCWLISLCRQIKANEKHADRSEFFHESNQSFMSKSKALTSSFNTKISAIVSGIG